jgi:5,10-methylenetetrahydromethanopterin reductase
VSERVALYLQDANDMRDGLDYVRYSEQRGFEAVWQAESRPVRDAIVPWLPMRLSPSGKRLGQV